MSALTNYLEHALINAVLRSSAYTSPTKVYLGLHTESAGEAGTGAEVSGGSYARQEVAFDAPSNGSTTNSADVLFPVATAAWGTISHFALWDASTAGNALLHGAFTQSKQIESGDQFKVAQGNMTITFD